VGKSDEQRSLGKLKRRWKNDIKMHLPEMEHEKNSRGAYRVLCGNLMNKEHLENLSVDGRMILKCIFQRCGMWWTVEVRTGFLWGNLMERAHLENLWIDGRIILKCIFQRCGTWRRVEVHAGFCGEI
jgi:hypothetical protein